MKAEYRRDLQNNYLILETKEAEQEDDYRIHMVEQNRIPGLLPFHRSGKDGIRYLNYEITGKQPLADQFERRCMSGEDILSVLSGVREVLETLQRYLLSPEKLLFDPNYIYTEPERSSLLFCYVPEPESEAPVSLLAEFILRRLDHQDTRAVKIGYQFYEKTQEENFSLPAALRELMTGYQSGGIRTDRGGLERRKENPAEERAPEQEGGEYPFPAGMPDYRRRDGGGFSYRTEDRERTVEQADRGTAEQLEMQRRRGIYQEEASGRPRVEKSAEGYGEHVEHRTRKHAEYTRAESKKEGLADRLFRMVHPAILLMTLLLLAVLEILFYMGILQTTEAGGAFFLILSAAMLLNSQWKQRREQKKKMVPEDWEDEEEESEEAYEYELLKRQMYSRKEDLHAASERPEYIEETRCLTDLPMRDTMRLICVPSSGMAPGGGAEKFPDFTIGEEAVTVGKIKGQCDVLLEDPVISRIHARLEYRHGEYTLKDMNSRNGTFLNGERLKPKETRRFSEGDRISFADIQYRAVKQ